MKLEKNLKLREEIMLTNPKSVGVVLNLSLRHMKDGLRLADIVKEELIKFVRTFDDEDFFYVFRENNLKPTNLRGKQVYEISNYQPKEIVDNPAFALQQTLYVLAAEDDDSQKFLYFITDCHENDKAVKKIMNLNKKDAFKIDINVVTIGNFTEQSAFGLHLDNPHQLEEYFKEKNKDGNLLRVSNLESFGGGRGGEGVTNLTSIEVGGADTPTTGTESLFYETDRRS